MIKRRPFFESFSNLGIYNNNKNPKISMAPRFDEYNMKIITVINMANENFLYLVNKGKTQNDVRNKYPILFVIFSLVEPRDQ